MKRVNADNSLLYYASSSSSQSSLGIDQLPSSSCLSNTSSSFKKSKPQRDKKPPSNYIPTHKAKTMPLEILEILQSISIMNQDTDGSSSYFKFIFFLGAQGKEFRDIIQEQFPFSVPVLFITSNCFDCTNVQCKILMNFFEIKDPMGAGIYPLDYLVITHDDKIHCKVPINFSVVNKMRSSIRNGGVSGHLKFGLDLNELPSLIEEYILYKK